MSLKNNTFLLEIYVEDMPEKELKSISEVFFYNFKLYLKKKFINFNKIDYILTNRRIGLIINNINYNLTNLNYIKIKGPNILNIYNNKEKYNFILHKWINKFKIKINNIKYLITDKGIWLYFLKYKIKKENIKNILLKVFYKCIKFIFNDYKIMRWNNKNNYFIRPIRKIIFMLNKDVINGNLFEINFDRITYKHRSYKNSIIYISDSNKYKKLLKLSNVIVNYNDRKIIIKKSLLNIEKKLNGKIIIDDIILNKIILSSEWPTVLYVRINKNYFLNKNILIPIIYNYYNYLLIYDNKNNNELLPFFIWISNISVKKYNLTINCHKKFINSLLKEIKKLLNLDLKYPLINNLKKLKYIVFRKNLGSIYSKILRVKEISIFISKKNNVNQNKIILVCDLYKCDIITNIVKEFPLLQGIVGMYLSLKNGIPIDVSICIKEQYDYKFIKHNKLSNNISSILAISEKMDNIIGNLFLYINENKNDNNLNLENDPYAIRKDINYIIHILINNNIKVSIFELIDTSIFLYKFLIKNLYKNIINKLFLNRIILFFLKKGYKKNIIKSVLLKEKENIFDINLRLESLININNKHFLLKTYKRIFNLLNKNLSKKLFINIQNFSNLDKKFLNIINCLDKRIFILKKKYKYNIILEKLEKFCIFINNFLDKSIIYNKDNDLNKNNKIYLLNKSINIISSINNIFILYNNYNKY